jgi:hypothetical protein
MIPRDKRGYRKPRREVVGVKQSDNLFMDGTSWHEFKRRCDEFMRSRGLPKEVTPIFIQQ